MGNCQAIDAATLVIQHPNGKVEKLYWPVTASEIMRMNPGHYVALLITTTLYKTTSSSKTTTTTSETITTTTTGGNKTTTTTSTSGGDHDEQHHHKKTTTSNGNNNDDDNNSVRITRVKLLRPTDTLALGHVYRLITTKEVMKGLVAKKQAKLRKHGIQLSAADDDITAKDVDAAGLKDVHQRMNNKYQLAQQVSSNNNNSKHQRQRTSSTSSSTSRTTTTNTIAAAAAKSKSLSWQPSLKSISEATS